MKKLIAIVLTVLMLSTTVLAGNVLLIAPNPNAAPKPVKVQVEGVDGTLGTVSVNLGEDNSALWVIQQALEELNIDYTVAESPYGGSYISQAAGLKEGAFGGYEGWLYYIDGFSPAVSIDAATLKGGENVVFIYTDFDVLVPIVEAQRDRKGIVTLSLTADVSTYDENWNVTVTRQPVADAAFTVEGETYMTDAQGKAVLSAELSAKAEVSIKLSKKNASGLPALLPLAFQVYDLSGAKVILPFSDLEEGQWYTEPVLQMSDLGVVNGMPDGTFRPDGTVTRAQVANMLFKLSGGIPANYAMTFSDVSEGQWYTEAIRWAASEGIVTGSEGKFRPDDAVTRQDLAVMLVRYQEKVVKAALPEKAKAPAFADNADIAPYAAEAVYLLQKAGIVSGDNGNFLPKATATRGAVCKMLSGLVVSD